MNSSTLFIGTLYYSQHGLRCASKPGLVLISNIGALLDLDHLDLLEDLKTMATFDQKNNVAGSENSAFEIVAIVIVEIDAHTPRFQDQDLLCVVNLPPYWIVKVRFDDLAGRMTHVGELLR